MNERLIEIMFIACKLGWVTDNKQTYPLMQISEVEKCMIAMVDDDELNRMRQWSKQVDLHLSNKEN